MDLATLQYPNAAQVGNILSGWLQLVWTYTRSKAHGSHMGSKSAFSTASRGPG